MMRRLRARLGADERGLSLVELLVATSMSLIIIVAVGGFFLASVRAAKTDSTSESSVRQASNMMDTLTQYIHAGTVLPTAGGNLPAIAAATSSNLVFYAYVNLSSGTATQPVEVQFTTDASGDLIENIWNSSLAGGYYTFPSYTTTTPNQTVNLGGPIASPTSDGASSTLFVYLDANGNTVGAPVTAANLGSVRAVQVNLEVGSQTAGTAGDTHIQNTLYLFNVGYSVTASPTP